MENEQIFNAYALDPGGAISFVDEHNVTFRPKEKERPTVLVLACFGDLIGKLDKVRVARGKCGRSGRYRLQRLIDERGRNAKVIDWMDEINADCPKKMTNSMNDQCGARCPDFPKVP